MIDLGEITNLAAIQQHLSLRGKFVVDAGCGNLAFTQILLDEGARVLAIDPDPVQAESNRQIDPVPHLEFAETGAESIPAESNSVDGVFFAYSLHHVPEAILSNVFDEVLRVLSPNGFLYVIEPIDCPLNQVMKLFHNEDKERATAWAALKSFAESNFQSVESFTYHSYSQFDSFDHFARHYGNRSFNPDYTEADVRTPQVEAAFEKHGKPDYRFASPKNVMLMREFG